MFHPEIFQGSLRKTSYFEGWYFKHSTPDGQVLAVIPGISLVKKEDRHAFIQVLTPNHESYYLSYPIESFRARKNRFSVQIGENYFSRKGIELNIDRDDCKLKGTMEYEGSTPFPVSLASPGIMGWYGYVPFMECFHGVVSINHSLRGKFHLNGDELNFTGGKGYIEKDWGTSFPKDYIWIQSNDFSDRRVSFMLSVALIPWMGREFVGFLGFLSTGDDLYRFATYNRSSIRELALSDQSVSLRIGNSRHEIWVTVQGKPGVSLAAPGKGSMHRYIKESVHAKVRITLKDKSGTVLFDGTGDPGAFEVVGEIDKLI